ncbi:MAG: hypothetical protein RLZZ367_812, partial [Bacteroidota bacterium]
ISRPDKPRTFTVQMIVSFNGKPYKTKATNNLY